MKKALQIGQFNELEVVELIKGGALLGAEPEDLFLPKHLLPDDVERGVSVRVFIYVDREGAPQATTWEPATTAGGFAYLRCVSTTAAGAYLDWGVPKDLFVPLQDQTTRMVEGRRYVVAVLVDKKGEKLVGSMHLADHFDYEVGDVNVDDEVELLVHGHVEAGALVVVAGRHRGLIHHSDTQRELRVGDTLRGYVRRVREDNRLDVGLTRRGVAGIADARGVILEALENVGTLALTDKSAPEEIKRVLGLSKKAFKRGVGALYRERLIVLGEEEISLKK